MVCKGGDQALYLLRGKGFQSRLFDADSAASDLIDRLIDKLANGDSKDCRVAASLTDDDRAESPADQAGNADQAGRAQKAGRLKRSVASAEAMLPYSASSDSMPDRTTRAG